MTDLKAIAQYIVDTLKDCRFDDVTSSVCCIIKEFENGTDRTVDVYKSSMGGYSHYVIYCSYEDENVDFKYTNDLSIEQLISKLEEVYTDDE